VSDEILTGRHGLVLVITISRPDAVDQPAGTIELAERITANGPLTVATIKEGAIAFAESANPNGRTSRDASWISD
jgi:hypothetical protein